MKKLLILPLAILMLISLTACNTNTTVVVVSITGTVSIERGSNTNNASGGMRLSNLDTVRTAAASEAELKLDDKKTAWLEEFTALHVDKQSSVFALTLLEGYLTIKINEQLKTGEDFTVHAGNVVLGVRGTVFMVDYNPVTGIVDVYVESGSVVVKNVKTGEVLATLSAGESEKFDAGTVDYGAASSGNSGGDDFGTQQTQDNSGGGDTTTSGGKNTYPPTDLPDGFHRYEYGIITYEGYWKRGLPNGHGIITMPGNWVVDDVVMFSYNEITEGDFVDGLMHGTVTRSTDIEYGCSCFPDGKEIWIFEVNMGYPTVDYLNIESDERDRFGSPLCVHGMQLTSPTLVFGVPPWCYR